ncbi:MAG: acetyl-CoA carboxylase biotin carboxylase subunit, partial [Candidatus Thermoplasmatota archaeon]|nr:acetyl-CoA carboxylase biotin carboxylase subunit [Candidatus Thermoplasmatota archaeon]
NEQFIKGNYNTSFIPRYKILDQVVEHVKNTKAQSPSPKTAAVMAAIQAVIIATSSSQKKN